MLVDTQEELWFSVGERPKYKCGFMPILGIVRQLSHPMRKRSAKLNNPAQPEGVRNVMKKKSAIAAALIAGLALYGFFFYQNRAPDYPVESQMAVSVISGSAVFPEQLSVAPAASKGVDDEMSRSDDLYALMLQYAKSDDPVALWKVAKIAEYCAEFGRNPKAFEAGTQAALSYTTVNKKMYQAARQSIAHQCRMFAAVEAQDDIAENSLLAHFTRAAKAGSVAAEAALLARRAPLSADDSYIRSVLDKTLRSRDPDAYVSIATVAVDSRLRSLAEAQIKGVTGDQGGIYAWYLAACHFGLDCTQSGALMTKLCSDAFLCGISLEQMVFNQELSLAEADRIRRMTSIIINGKNQKE